MQHLRYAELHDYTLHSLTQRAVVPNKGNQSPQQHTFAIANICVVTDYNGSADNLLPQITTSCR